MSGGQQPDPITVDEITAALRHDPIVLSSMLGGGDTAEISRVLHAALSHSTVPVYVVLAPTPAGLDGDNVDEQLVSLIHARLDRPGVYFVETADNDVPHMAIGVYGDGVYHGLSYAGSELELGVFSGAHQIEQAAGLVPGSAGPTIQPATDAAILLDLTAHAKLVDVGDDPNTLLPVLSPAQVQALSATPWIEPGYFDTSGSAGPDGPGGPGGLGSVTAQTSFGAVAIGLTVALLAFRSLRAGSAWRAQRISAAPAPSDRPRLGAGDRSEPWQRAPVGPSTGESGVESVRPQARTALAELDRSLAGPAAVGADPLHLQRACGSRDAAAGLVDSADLLDVVGALVLARGGTQALTRPDRLPYAPCFVDPRHGGSTTVARVRGGLSVPTCARCRRRVESGGSPEALLDARGRAYYLGRTVWARTGYGSIQDDLWRRVPTRRRRGWRRWAGR